MTTTPPLSLTTPSTEQSWAKLLAEFPREVTSIIQDAARNADLPSLRCALAAGAAVTGESDDAIVDRFFCIAHELSKCPGLARADQQARSRDLLLQWGARLKSQGLLQLALCTFPLHLVRGTHFSAVEVLVELGADPYGLVEVTPRMHRLKGLHGINAAGELFAYFSPGSEEVVHLARAMFADIPADSDLDAAFPTRVVAPTALGNVTQERASLPEFAAAMNFSDLLDWCIERLNPAARRELRLRLGQLLLKVFGVAEAEDGTLRQAGKPVPVVPGPDRRTAIYLIASGAEFERNDVIWPQILEMIRFDAPFVQDLAAGQVLHFTISKLTQWRALNALIEIGAVDLHTKLEGGSSMLHFAAQFSNKVAVKQLLDLGAKPAPAESIWFANAEHGDNDEILNLLRVARLRQIILDASQRAPLDTTDDRFC